MPLRDTPPGHLKRLPPGHYRGCAWVHWTMTIDQRKRGWLDHPMHSTIREFLLHTCARHWLLCPAYCLMPDHAHFLWMGLCGTSDQQRAAKFFRTHWNRSLSEGGVKLQKQAYDHVMTSPERDPDEFSKCLFYILANPERANLVDQWRDWPYLGTVAAGFPDLDPREPEKFPGKFWKIYNQQVTKFAGA